MLPAGNRLTPALSCTFSLTKIYLFTTSSDANLSKVNSLKLSILCCMKFIHLEQPGALRFTALMVDDNSWVM